MKVGDQLDKIKTNLILTGQIHPVALTICLYKINIGTL